MNIFKSKKPERANNKTAFSADELIISIKALNYGRKNGKINQQDFLNLMDSFLAEYNIPASMQKKFQTLK